jgi:ribosome biogenesis protein UTP30
MAPGAAAAAAAAARGAAAAAAAAETAPPGAAAALAAAAALPGLKREQVARAVAGLIKHAAAAADAAVGRLFEEDELIYVTLALKRSPHPSGPHKVKPIRLPLPHPLMTTEGAEVALFVKDSKGEGHKAAKARLAKFTGRGGVNKVIGLSKLRSKYESHEAKRQLCGLFDIFLADERILPSLPKLIGKSFFKKRKTPIPVDITAANFPEQVKRAVEQSTFMAPPAGSCVTVRAARCGMGAAAATENVLAVIAAAAGRVPKKWANVQAVYVKTSESVALPVYQVLPDKPLRIDGGGEAGAGGEADGSGSEEEEDEEQPAAAAPKRGGGGGATGKAKPKAAAAAAAKGSKPPAAVGGARKPQPAGKRRVR